MSVYVYLSLCSQNNFSETEKTITLESSAEIPRHADCFRLKFWIRSTLCRKQKKLFTFSITPHREASVLCFVCNSSNFVPSIRSSVRQFVRLSLVHLLLKPLNGLSSNFQGLFLQTPIVVHLAIVFPKCLSVCLWFTNDLRPSFFLICKLVSTSPPKSRNGLSSNH